jgi:hypothetical protein
MQNYLSALPNAVQYISGFVLVYSFSGIGAVRTHAICPRTPDFDDNLFVPDIPGIDPDILQSEQLFDILVHRGGGKLRFSA